jgi:hypothetical protein
MLLQMAWVAKVPVRPGGRQFILPAATGKRRDRDHADSARSRRIPKPISDSATFLEAGRPISAGTLKQVGSGFRSRRPAPADDRGLRPLGPGSKDTPHLRWFSEGGDP